MFFALLHDFGQNHINIINRSAWYVIGVEEKKDDKRE